MGEIIILICRPTPSIPAGAGAFIMLMAFQILHYPDLNIWVMVAIAAFCGFVLTLPSAIFIIGWLAYALYKTYN